MFTTHPDNMRMESTPERVFSVCRLVSLKSLSREELRDALTLGKTRSNTIINYALDVAEKDLMIIQNKDGKLILLQNRDILTSPITFRRYVSANVFSYKTSTFYLFTKWVISQNERVFSINSWEVLAKTAEKEVEALSGLGENAALGWRFWASFLGIGYLNETNFLPNMKIRIQDVLATEFPLSFQYGEPIKAKDFTSWISVTITEVNFEVDLPYAFSSGLRTLHDLGLIVLESRRDTERINLFYVDGDPINDFSHITVTKEVCL